MLASKSKGTTVALAMASLVALGTSAVAHASEISKVEKQQIQNHCKSQDSCKSHDGCKAQKPAPKPGK